MIDFKEAAVRMAGQDHLVKGKFEDAEHCYCALGMLGVVYRGEAYVVDHGEGETWDRDGSEFFEEFMCGNAKADGSWEKLKSQKWGFEFDPDDIAWMEFCAERVVDEYPDRVWTLWSWIKGQQVADSQDVRLTDAWHMGWLTPADVIAFYNDFVAETPQDVADLLAHEGRWAA